NVRRNRLGDFRNVRSSGLIAMKLDEGWNGEGDRLIGVATCREEQDVMLATRKGRAIRFQITDDTLRVFAGRDSTGVRGIRLGEGDSVNSLAVLTHVEATPAEREGYLRMANARRRVEVPNGDAANGDAEAVPDGMEIEDPVEDGEAVAATVLDPERFGALELAEEILLTVTDGGFGKRSSAHDYRATGRGGQGIANIQLLPRRNGKEVVATLPVLPGTDVMLVTDAGRLIRVPADQVRITGRQSMGVRLFRLGRNETVISVFPVLEAVDALDAEEAEMAVPEQGEAATDAGEGNGDA
ncbi:MAG: DNA gyrase subunit A, partial [Gluconacetobacter diazotrophicus]|nr:DNA gyrase subunit A [Gluconacetobacter diazotrophicus]